MLQRLARSTITMSNTGILQIGPLSERICFQRGYSAEQPRSASEKFVLLHDENGRVIGSRSFPAAEEVARKLKMRLVRIEGPNYKKEWYKLAPKQELVKADPGVAKQSEMKAIAVGLSIGAHDLNTKAKQVAKWIKQNTSVRLAITGNAQTKNEHVEPILKQFQDHLEGIPHEIQQSPLKNGVLRCIIRPSDEKSPSKS